MFNLLQRYTLKLPTILYEYDKSVCVFGGGEMHSCRSGWPQTCYIAEDDPELHLLSNAGIAIIHHHIQLEVILFLKLDFAYFKMYFNIILTLILKFNVLESYS